MQVAPIIQGEVDMTVLEHYYHLLPTSEFRIAKRSDRWGPHMGTLVYRRDLWEAKGIRYPDNSLGEVMKSLLLVDRLM